MGEFYEILIRLPNDLETQVAGMLQGSVDKILQTGVHLPRGCIWDMDQVDVSVVVLAEQVVKVIVQYWEKLCPFRQAQYFIQLERGHVWHHLHCLLSKSGIESLVLGRYVRKLKEQIIDYVFDGVEPNVPDWLAITKTRLGGKNQVVGPDYIERYLLPKTQPEAQWAWTNLPQYAEAILNSEKRLEYNSAAVPESAADTGSSDPVLQGPTVSSAAASHYSRLVDWLISEGITSEQQWLERDKESYRSFHANSNSSRQLKAAVENAKCEMLLTKTAADYLIGPLRQANIADNRVFRLFMLNQYDPRIAGTILVKWCQKGWGKRNTIWLTGPATTGKTNLAQAIAHSTPLYGCVNWNNENFPFNDCVHKMLIWWEEGKMTAKIVEAAKAICGGSKVRVDQKCKSSIQIDSTPVIITSNVDMTLVVDGNSITQDHAEPLQHRMWKFTFNEILPPDWGQISKEEVQHFFGWAASNLMSVEPVFEVPKDPHVTGPPIVDLTDEEMIESLPVADGVTEPAKRETGPGTSSPIPSCSTQVDVICVDVSPLKEDTEIVPQVGIDIPRVDSSSSETELELPCLPENPARYGTRCACCGAISSSAIKCDGCKTWQATLVCLEHNVPECPECGIDACLFTQGEAESLLCDERMSQFSDLSDVQPLPDSPCDSPSPISQRGDRSPLPTLHEMFDLDVNDPAYIPWRFHPN